MRNKKSLITLLIVATIILMPLMSGCKNQLKPENVKQIAADINNLTVQLDEYQAASQTLADQMAVTGTFDPDIAAKIAKINAEADKIQTQIKLMSEALKSVELTGDDVQDLITLLQQINAVSAPWNPYAAPAAAGMALLSLILGAIAKAKAKQSSVNKKDAEQKTIALTEVVKGGEFFKKDATADELEHFKDAQNKAQLTPETRQLVAALKTSVKTTI